MRVPGLTQLSRAQLQHSQTTKNHRHVIYSDSDTSNLPSRKAIRLTTLTNAPELTEEAYVDTSSFESPFHPTEYYIDPDEDEPQQMVPFEWMDPSFVFKFDEEVTTPGPKRQRRPGSLHPLLNFIPQRDVFLQERIRLEGRGVEDGAPMTCGLCKQTDAAAYYRCETCFDCRLFCAGCIVNNHAANPFHWVQLWDGSFFIRRSLSELGLCLQLGHPIGEACGRPVAVKNEVLVVLHTNGIHSVKLNYCNCVQAPLRHVQLLRSRLFPATVGNPQTAATFELLELFQMLGFMSKASGFELFQTLVRLTDNIGNPVPDRYKSLMCILREWRHVRLMARMGKGHDIGGISAATAGSCAVLCPACPHPNINLPPDYNEGPLSKTWVYTLFLAMDANFRLKRLDVSNDANDPGLNDGTAFVVNETRYKEFLDEFGEKIEVDTSTCNNHDAIKSANVRGGKGIAASGVGAVDCRHDMKRPTSVGDLQKGERYVNMDYLFVSNLKRNAPQRVSQSYDIVCQWTKHLLERLALYEPTVSLNLRHDFNFFIPKWHIAAHRASCQTDYSFYWSPYVGRTDGEAPERGWAAMNSIASSTKEMGPGSRRDTLDDFFGDYNWRKVIAVADALLVKVKDAVPERAEHVSCFVELCDSIADSSPDLIQTWTAMVQAWEADRTKLNPFVSTREVLSIHKVRLELAEEDQQHLAKGTEDKEDKQVHQEVTLSEFLSQAIELEDVQSVLATDYSNISLHPTELQKAKLRERRNRLLRRILSWIDLQKDHMPGVSRLRKDCSAMNQGIAESIPLLMPSAVMKKVKVSQELLDFEWRYRIAQIGTTLDDLRRHLLLRDQLYSSKDRHVRGQRANTRSRGVIQRLEGKVKNDAQKYRQILQQLISLNDVVKNDGQWKKTWLPLAEADVSGLRNFDEGRVLSWIWRRSGVVDNTDLRNEGESYLFLSSATVRIEWCKSRARAHRWQEECYLLQEEMWRVKAYFKYRSQEWRAAAATPHNIKNEGRRAYAIRQAAIFDSLYIRCISVWSECEGYLTMGDDTVDAVATVDTVATVATTV
ncbi:hypothetical protein BDN72DRAFT_914121 [Pluteus cervinus]|uniref:Uncharacterized protein n=1 Tax=Pluteus cervinus TaxID=181527 RepID=A0ACD3B8S1_9AGAR|nr:hypothetical protein BDN72DRAFT_914121 [Pluteus cervinus]